ncbi:hypothetical protein [Devosia sp. A449]
MAGSPKLLMVRRSERGKAWSDRCGRRDFSLPFVPSFPAYAASYHQSLANSPPATTQMERPMREFSVVLPLMAAAAALVVAPAFVAGNTAVIRSTVVGIAITPLSKLPPAPSIADASEFCAHLAIPPTSPGGLVAERAGWRVTGELDIGVLTAVSFVGGFEPGTSGSCQSHDGNVGFFAGKALVAVAYAAPSAPLPLGRIERFGNHGLRLWDGDYLPQPLADISLGADGAITIAALAAEETFCGGGAIVPYIYGLPLAEARNKIGQFGWMPVEPSLGEWPDQRSADLAALGLTEVTGCSGTGFGYCGFEYHSAQGRLSVSSVGEAEPPATPTVAGYTVTCAPG